MEGVDKGSSREHRTGHMPVKAIAATWPTPYKRTSKGCSDGSLAHLVTMIDIVYLA